jgi:hypothetical protein
MTSVPAWPSRSRLASASWPISASPAAAFFGTGPDAFAAGKELSDLGIRYSVLRIQVAWRATTPGGTSFLSSLEEDAAVQICGRRDERNVDGGKVASEQARQPDVGHRAVRGSELLRALSDSGIRCRKDETVAGHDRGRAGSARTEIFASALPSSSRASAKKVWP